MRRRSVLAASACKLSSITAGTWISAAAAAAAAELLPSLSGSVVELVSIIGAVAASTCPTRSPYSIRLRILTVHKSASAATGIACCISALTDESSSSSAAPRRCRAPATIAEIATAAAGATQIRSRTAVAAQSAPAAGPAARGIPSVAAAGGIGREDHIGESHTPGIDKESTARAQPASTGGTPVPTSAALGQAVGERKIIHIDRNVGTGVHEKDAAYIAAADGQAARARAVKIQTFENRQHRISQGNDAGDREIDCSASVNVGESHAQGMAAAVVIGRIDCDGAGRAGNDEGGIRAGRRAVSVDRHHLIVVSATRK